MDWFEPHEERTDLPDWDTKVRCTCGFESVSRAEQWKHAAESFREFLRSMTPAAGQQGVEGD